MRKIFCPFFLLILCHSITIAQPIQTLRVTVNDAVSEFPLAGVNIRVYKDSSIITGCNTDANGLAEIKNIPIGRINLLLVYVGYQSLPVNNLILNSGKELVMNLKMERMVKNISTITITAGNKNESLNEMASVSNKQFSIDETNRYAGSRGDPARMASNFAGVQGADDSRNDIVIRGNSPQGVLWRVEGIDIFNPNHFAIPGTGGGSVSILNNKILANSDFFTGAFPAEYGNSIAGVFDLKLRNGNANKFEFSGQLGLLGTELLAEGPFNKKHHSSFLFTYRYSTLALFGGLGIKIGTDAIPYYQDVSLRLNFPMKKNWLFSFYAIGGASNIDIKISDQKKPSVNIYGENDRDQYFKSKMGVTGFSLSKVLNANSFFKINIALNAAEVKAYHELVYRHVENDLFVVDSLSPLLNYTFNEMKLTVHPFFNSRLNSKVVMKAGVNTDLFNLSYLDSVKDFTNTSSTYNQWSTRWNAKNDQPVLLQPYLQFKINPNDNFTINAGWHLQYFSLSKSISFIEPRIGFKYQLPKRQSISFGAGIHSQIQSTYLYYYRGNNYSKLQSEPYNKNVGFSKSIHSVIGYSKQIGKQLLFKTEIYFQYLFQIPVDTFSSSFSAINSGAGFSRIFPNKLINDGIGRNYGIEFTLEKNFSKHYLFLFTLSLFDSKYQGSDRIWRNTDFNGRYASNFLFTREWEWKKKNIFSLGLKLTSVGGKWYGSVDTLQSALHRDLIFEDANRNTKQFPAYFRADIKINFRFNTLKFTHEIGIDLVNVLNTKNILKLTYAPDNTDPKASPIRYEYQLGFLPLFYYKIEF